jgi:hypothetical protein
MAAIKINAKQRLLATKLEALPKFMYMPTEQEVMQNKAYPQLLRMAEKLTNDIRKFKTKMVSYDALERPIVRRLLSEETGINFNDLSKGI